MKTFYKLTLDAEQRDFVDAIKDPTVTIVFCNAAAGTGKTTLAFGAANLLYHDKRNTLDGIVYIVSPYGEQKQGYLPGSYTEKSEVYFEPAYQAMIEVDINPYNDVCNESMLSKKKGDGYVKLLTHTFLRGTNLKNKIVILDEAQNYTVAALHGIWNTSTARKDAGSVSSPPIIVVGSVPTPISCNWKGGDLMGKVRMLGQFKPCIPNSRVYGKSRRSPWEGMPKKKAPAAATEKKEGKK